jgi:hypothetical protein
MKLEKVDNDLKNYKSNSIKVKHCPTSCRQRNAIGRTFFTRIRINSGIKKYGGR